MPAQIIDLATRRAWPANVVPLPKAPADERLGIGDQVEVRLNESTIRIGTVAWIAGGGDGAQVGVTFPGGVHRTFSRYRLQLSRRAPFRPDPGPGFDPGGGRAA